MTTAAAAGLVAMAARFSDGLPRADAVAARADEMRRRLSSLADDDAEAYEAVLAAYRNRDGEPGPRRERIRAALQHAADVPAAIVELARETGELGVELAEEGNPNLRGDAVTAVLLAEAAARSATYLVELNVSLGRLDGGQVERSRAGCAALAEAARRVKDAP